PSKYLILPLPPRPSHTTTNTTFAHTLTTLNTCLSCLGSTSPHCPLCRCLCRRRLLHLAYPPLPRVLSCLIPSFLFNLLQPQESLPHSYAFANDNTNTITTTHTLTLTAPHRPPSANQHITTAHQISHLQSIDPSVKIASRCFAVQFDRQKPPLHSRPTSHFQSLDPTKHFTQVGDFDHV
ncbi:hypothetical protein RB213_002531, partial [Colletotrichum asianum]